MRIRSKEREWTIKQYLDTAFTASVAALSAASVTAPPAAATSAATAVAPPVATTSTADVAAENRNGEGKECEEQGGKEQKKKSKSKSKSDSKTK